MIRALRTMLFSLRLKIVQAGRLGCLVIFAEQMPYRRRCFYGYLHAETVEAAMPFIDANDL
jgi:hypothetical protein